jgi:hypothetical protein
VALATDGGRRGVRLTWFTRGRRSRLCRVEVTIPGGERAARSQRVSVLRPPPRAPWVREVREQPLDGPVVRPEPGSHGTGARRAEPGDAAHR